VPIVFAYIPANIFDTSPHSRLKSKVFHGIVMN
jgi:hypothetical protein